MARRKKRGGGRYATQVRAESILRFNPERSSLKSALRQAGDARKSAISGAKYAASQVRAGADAARPEYQRAFEDAARPVGEILARLGVSSPDNAVARDSAGTTRRMSEALQTALDDAASRKLDADAGLAFSIDKANSEFAGTSRSIRERLAGIGREQGAFQQARSGELSAAATERSFKAKENAKGRKNARLTAGVDAQGRVIRGGVKDIDGDGKPDSKGKGGAEDGKTPAGVKALSAKDHQALKNDESGAEQAVRDTLRALKVDLGSLSPGQKKAVRQRVARSVRKGTPSITVSQPGSAEGQRTSTTVPGQKPVANDLALKLALDMVFDRHVSRGYRQLLWQNGYVLRMLGLPGPNGTGGGGSKKGRPGPKSTAQGQANDRASVATAAHVTVRTHTRRRPTRKK